jgi:ABC-type phosphate/phosphonate transport system permease subunit
MTRSRGILVFGGLILAAFGMLYGLHYALFVEHQTLDHMGGTLTQAFALAADRNTPRSTSALEAYSSTKYDYVRQVDAHSHWIGLAMIMVVIGLAFDRVNFSEAFRAVIAFSLLVGGTLFPLAVLLQTYHHGAVMFKALAVASSGLVIAALTAAALGFARPSASA